MRKNSILIYTAMVGVCFLYTGSAYMSQMYRLFDYYDANTVDMITSTINYLCQALGMAIYAYGLRRNIAFFRQKRSFTYLMLAGIFFMMAMQLLDNGPAILASGIFFNVLIGLYFGFYLSMMALYIPSERLGLSYGLSYAFGSVGTYILSLIYEGEFLTSKYICVIYALLATLTIILIECGDDIVCQSEGIGSAANIGSLVVLLVIMGTISTIGSGLYMSLPMAENVNFSLIRAFYAIGLIATGIIFDRSRAIGNIVTIASLTYPLIATVITRDLKITTGALALSYVFIGFFSVYRASAFMDIGGRDSSLLYLSCIGLMASRIVEAILSLVIIYVDIPDLVELVVSSVLFAVLIVIYFLHQDRAKAKESMSDEERFSLFAKRYGLSQREIELFECVYLGMSDKEIAEKLYISTNTVRFHLSNIMKKTSTSSRVEAVRLFVSNQ